MTFQAFSETRLREDLRALRHLPPGSRLPHPSTQEERQLLADLLSLSHDEDPLRWLSAERGPLSAQVALQHTLQQIQQRAVGLRRSIARHRGAIPVEEQALLGGLLQEVPLVVWLEQGALASPGLLRDLLRQVRAVRGTSSGTQPSEPAYEEQQLLWDLLALPDVVDPLHWLQVERSRLVARVTLNQVLAQSRPARTLHIGPMIWRQRLRDALRTPAGIHIVIEELAFGASGFAISANLRLAARGVAQPRLMLAWLGFDRVVDNRGHHYLLQHYEMGVHTQMWWLKERLRMAFYPALSADATTLIFSSRPAVLQVMAVNQPIRRPQPLPDQHIGDLTWQAKVPPNLAARNTSAQVARR